MLFLNNTTCDTRAPVKVGDKLKFDSDSYLIKDEVGNNSIGIALDEVNNENKLIRVSKNI